ncbi:MAG: 30S ribosomal protein S16 [Chloroflexi bacterium]|nr:30S ribosomal protein S16 [Chloroflexota bacterium]
MLRMRLRREGARMQPTYRIVVADSKAPRNGGFIEVIGFYNPKTNPSTVKIDEARAAHWLKMGASPSEPVARILKQSKIAG